MKLDAEILVKNYYQQVKEKYPELSFEEFKQACYSPFEFVKQEMASGELPVIRLKYFGTFLVYPKRAKNMLNELDGKLNNGNISQKNYDKFKIMIKKYLDEQN